MRWTQLSHERSADAEVHVLRVLVPHCAAALLSTPAQWIPGIVSADFRRRACLAMPRGEAGTWLLPGATGSTAAPPRLPSTVPLLAGIEAPLTMNIPLALHRAASCAPSQFAYRPSSAQYLAILTAHRDPSGATPPPVRRASHPAGRQSYGFPMPPPATSQMPV